MARLRNTPGFFFARGFLGVCMVLGALSVINAVVTATSGDDVIREPHGLPRRALVDDPSWWLRLLDAAPGVLVGLIMAVAGFLVLVVVVDIQRGVPFEAKAGRRLRAAAVIVAVGVLVATALTAWADIEAVQAVGRRDRGFGTHFLWALSPGTSWLVVAALLAVFAHAFSEGTRLADDNEGLV